VRATATTGYVIKSGATTRWSGNLGRHHKCAVVLGIKSVATEHVGETTADPWRVTVRTTVPKKEKRRLSIAYLFDTDITLVPPSESGWTCTEPEGGNVTCTFAPAGTKPPQLSIWVNGLDSESPFSPAGTVILYAGGKAIAVRSFSE
jgi:hypothetical protein